MLPMNNLQFGELLSFDSMPASETPLPEGADDVEGAFANILQVRVDTVLEFQTDDGDVLPHAGNSLPLLPPQLVPSAELRPAVAFIAKDFFDTNPQEPIDGRPNDYFDGSVVDERPADLALIEPPNANLVADVKTVLQAIVPNTPQAEPRTTIAPPPTPPVLTKVRPSVTPHPESVQLPKATVTAARVPAELVSPTVERENGRSLAIEVRARLTQRDTAVPRIFGMRGHEIATTRSPTRPVTPTGLISDSPEDVDVELPPLRVNSNAPGIGGDTSKFIREDGQQDGQPLPRPLASNTSQAGPISVETTTSADTGARLIADTTTTAPRPLSPSLSTQTIAYSIEMPVQESGWDKAISERVLLMANGKLQNAEIRLTPAELGPLRVQIAIDDGTANVSFQAQHALTREAIELAMPRLREMLAEQGLSLGQMSVSDDGVQHGGREDAERARPDNSVVTDDRDVEDLNEGSVHRRVDDGLVDTFA